MPSWDKSSFDLLVKIINDDPELASRINATAKFLKKHPLSGELTIKPNTRYYTDPDGKFRISYEIEKDDILVTVIHLF